MNERVGVDKCPPGTTYRGHDQGGHLFAAIALFQAFRACKRVPVAITPFLYFSKRLAA